ncbi:hypothetical protein DSO57_1033690 [Entomophthora muscae]|uniref:Uncharacterized protein n=1 Tax=Entomophthora muscae TaxID=34485 RepID=A0ACC2U9K6_9FUNG|nr:hypothetical protein DSO57_1033690 [Entomophthora muscae]
MSVKDSPGYVADNYIFNCNNQKQQSKSKRFVCEDKTCGAPLNTKGWEQLTAEKGEHTCEPPNQLITTMLKWYLVQVIPISSHLQSSDLAIKALHHLKPNNLKLVQTQDQLVKFISNKRIAAVRAQSALDSQLVSLEVIKHAAWKPPQSTFQGKIPPPFD